MMSFSLRKKSPQRVNQILMKLSKKTANNIDMEKPQIVDIVKPVGF